MHIVIARCRGLEFTTFVMCFVCKISKHVKFHDNTCMLLSLSYSCFRRLWRWELKSLIISVLYELSWPGVVSDNLRKTKYLRKIPNYLLHCMTLQSPMIPERDCKLYSLSGVFGSLNNNNLHRHYLLVLSLCAMSWRSILFIKFIWLYFLNINKTLIGNNLF